VAAQALQRCRGACLSASAWSSSAAPPAPPAPPPARPRAARRCRRAPAAASSSRRLLPPPAPPPAPCSTSVTSSAAAWRARLRRREAPALGGPAKRRTALVRTLRLRGGRCVWRWCAQARASAPSSSTMTPSSSAGTGELLRAWAAARRDASAPRKADARRAGQTRGALPPRRAPQVYDLRHGVRPAGEAARRLRRGKQLAVQAPAVSAAAVREARGCGCSMRRLRLLPCALSGQQQRQSERRGATGCTGDLACRSHDDVSPLAFRRRLRRGRGQRRRVRTVAAAAGACGSSAPDGSRCSAFGVCASPDPRRHVRSGAACRCRCRRA
jgi:hypothetical protein